MLTSTCCRVADRLTPVHFPAAVIGGVMIVPGVRTITPFSYPHSSGRWDSWEGKITVWIDGIFLDDLCAFGIEYRVEIVRGQPN